MTAPRLAALAALLVLAHTTPAQAGFAGEWFTSRGVLTLEREGDAIRGSYGEGQSLTGKVAGTELSFEASEGRVTLTGTLQLDRSGHRFTGRWRSSAGGSGDWRGWREDPAARKGRPAKLDGAWRTSWGLLELEQKGAELTGGYGAQGWSTVQGMVQGRHVELRYDSPFGQGTLAFDVDPDGKTALGSARSDRGRWPLQLQRLEDHARAPAPKPGVIVQGLARNRLTYCLRAPKGWQQGMPLLVILHGSNMGARPYVESVAATPVGERCVVVGIDGEQWQDWSRPDDPRHNYTYVNWMGRSTYQGYPNTHRESPALVAELLQDLREQLAPGRVFVGGHSQGGFLSWFFAMHFPELVDGVFPISCGLVIQCEPDVFADAALRAAQRRVAIAVVHGERDPNVPFRQGLGSWQSCVEQGFPMLRLFQNGSGHGFSSLPWQEAVAWLEAVTGDDAAALLSWADGRIDDGGYRDATAALLRLRQMELRGAAAAKRKELAARIDSFGEFDAERFLAKVAAGEAGEWVDEFLAFRDQFEFADCAAKVMAAWAELRARHEGPANELFGEARRLFQQGKRDEGWGKYRQIVAECWASPLYRRVQGWLEER